MSLDIKKILVHPGRYHADELLGVSILRTLFPKLKHVPIIRSRPTQEELDDPTVFVIDCGEVYDPSRNNFDHHQDKDLWCAARLIWNHFYPEDRPLIKKAMDIMFFRSIDRHDRGLAVAMTNSISIAVNAMNEQVPFEKALDFVETAFRSLLIQAETFIPVREYWYSGKSFGGTKYLRIFPTYCSAKIRDQFVEYARQRKKVLYLIWPVSEDGKHLLFSAIPTHEIGHDKRQLDNDGISAVYPTKDLALHHALELSVPFIHKRKKRAKHGYK